MTKGERIAAQLLEPEALLLVNSFSHSGALTALFWAYHDVAATPIEQPDVSQMVMKRSILEATRPSAKKKGKTPASSAADSSSATSSVGGLAKSPKSNKGRSAKDGSPLRTPLSSANGELGGVVGGATGSSAAPLARDCDTDAFLVELQGLFLVQLCAKSEFIERAILPEEVET